MDKLTPKVIQDACKDLQDALIESITLDHEMQELKQRQERCRYALLKAKEVIYNLKIQ